MKSPRDHLPLLDEHPAQFAGQLEGNRLTLTVTVSDTVEKKTVVLGPVTVTFGREPRMQQCPICRTPGEMATLAHDPDFAMSRTTRQLITEWGVIVSPEMLCSHGPERIRLDLMAGCEIRG